MHNISNSSGQLVSGSKQILDVLNMIDDSLQEMPDMPEIDVEELQEFPTLLRNAADSLKEFAESLDDFIDAIDGMEKIEIPDEALDQIVTALKEAGVDKETINDLINMYKFAKEAADFIGDKPEAIQETLLNMAKRQRNSADEIEENIALLDEVENYKGSSRFHR